MATDIWERCDAIDFGAKLLALKTVRTIFPDGTRRAGWNCRSSDTDGRATHREPAGPTEKVRELP